MKSFKRKYTETLLLAIAVVLMSACNSENKQNSSSLHEEEGHEGEHPVELTATQMETVGIKLGTFEKMNIGEGIEAYGELAVSPDAMADVSPFMAGKIKNINVVEGQKIKAGAVIGTIENLDLIRLQEEYRDAVKQVELARIENQRQERLRAEGAGVRKNYENSKIELEKATIVENSLKTQLEMAGINVKDVTEGKMIKTASVTAPIGGTVTKIYCRIGAWADPSTPMLVIVNESGIYANVKIYEKDLSKIEKGKEVKMTLINSGRHLLGKVSEINGMIDGETKAINVKVTIEGASKTGLIPGMGVEAYINGGGSETEVLPEESIVKIEGRDYIFILKGMEEERGENVYHFEPIEISKGNRRDNLVEVKPLEEIPENTKIVISKAYYIASMLNEHGEHNH